MTGKDEVLITLRDCWKNTPVWIAYAAFTFIPQRHQHLKPRSDLQHHKQPHTTVFIQALEIMVIQPYSLAQFLIFPTCSKGTLTAMRKISVHAGIWTSTKSSWHLSNPNCSLLWCWIPSTSCNGPLVWLSARTGPEAHTFGGRWLIQYSGSNRKWDPSCFLDMRGEEAWNKGILLTEKNYFKSLVWETCHRQSRKWFY